MAVYAYALMRAEDAAAAAMRERDPPVRYVEHEGLAALVTDIPDGAVRVRRDTLTLHSDVLQEAFRSGPLLPLRFGTVLRDEEALRRELLVPRRDHLLARLRALDGKAEMRVRANYVEEALLRSILDRDRHLADSARLLRTQPPAATHFDRLRLGEAVAVAVDARRRVDSRRLLERLAPLAIAVAVGEPQSELTALGASFLVDSEAIDRFEHAVERLSEEHGQSMQFKLIGPLPAHSFADGAWERAGHGAEVAAGWD
jgi:hypothetical protein